MNITFIRAKPCDAADLVKVYDAAFYADFVRFSYCPGYGKSVESMIESIKETEKYAISFGDRIIGAVSLRKIGENEYYIGCLAVVPEFQHQGIGQAAIRFVEKEYPDYKRLTLDTPVEKSENISFYVDKCGFKIIGEHDDGPVHVYTFEKTKL